MSLHAHILKPVPLFGSRVWIARNVLTNEWVTVYLKDKSRVAREMREIELARMREMYEEERRSLSEIGRAYGIGADTVYRRVKANGWRRRPNCYAEFLEQERLRKEKVKYKNMPACLLK